MPFFIASIWSICLSNNRLGGKQSYSKHQIRILTVFFVFTPTQLLQVVLKRCRSKRG